MRNHMTVSEQALWDVLKADGRPWWAQKPVGFLRIADFYLATHRLVVEVDGGYHLTPQQQANDAQRDEALRAHGYSVMHLTDTEVMASPQAAQRRIERRLRAIEVVQRHKGRRRL